MAIIKILTQNPNPPFLSPNQNIYMIYICEKINYIEPSFLWFSLLGYFWFSENIKKKIIKKNIFLIFGFSIKIMKENKI